MEQRIYSKIYESALQDERKRIQKFIEDIKNDVAGAPFFLNFFAPKGFRKTAFLERIWEDYEKVLPSSLVRVGEFREKDNKNIALKDLLVFIIHDLGESLPRRGAPLTSDYASWTNEKELAELLLSLV